MKETNRELISIIKRVVIAILLCVMMFSIAKIVSYYEQKAAADQMQDDILTEHVTPDDAQTPDSVVPEDDETAVDPAVPEEEETPDDEANAEDETTSEPTMSQSAVTTGGSAVNYADGSDGVSVDFSSLIARYPDVVAYIYGPDTKIQYPIAYSGDHYYLYRDLDGNENVNGSIYLEPLCATDFSSQNTLLYGHHMKSGLMFAGLAKYKSQSYYDSHPYFYIYTPYQNYRLDLFAGFVCRHDDEVFATSLTQSQLTNMAAKSTFRSNIGVPSGNVVSMCTCSYEFDNARYVVVGELVPIY